MKLYFLRHAHRNNDDILFRSRLNSKGKGYANSILKEKLYFLDIDEFYASPYIRVLETIKPVLCEKYSTKYIKIDYCLAEDLRNSKFEKTSTRDFLLNNNDLEEFRIDVYYKSIYDITQYKYMESDKDVSKRVLLFCDVLRFLEKNKVKKNILIASHEEIICQLVKNLYDIDGISLDFGEIKTHQDHTLRTV